MASCDNKDFKNEEAEYLVYFENYYSNRDKSTFKIKSITLAPCCAEGENFVADVIEITIIGHYLYSKEQLDTTKSIVIKKFPPKDSPLHLLYDLSKFYQNEIVAYEKILPMFENYIQNYNLKTCFPEYYGRGNDFLVLENLKLQNYQMVDRAQGLDHKECRMVLRELALFHAVSFALKSEDAFREKTNDLQESVFCPEYVDGMLGTIWDNSLNFAIKSLESSDNPKLIRTGEKLKKYSGSVLNHLIEITKPSDRYGVICHGDLWSNNVMIRYDDDGGRSPISVKLLDLQALRHSSCVLDVMHLIFTSTKPGTLDDLLKSYFGCLESVFKILRKEMNFAYGDLVEEFKGRILYGLLVSFMMFTVVTQRSDEKRTDFPFSKEELNSESVFLGMYSELNSDYHERTRDLVLKLLDLGFLHSL